MSQQPFFCLDSNEILLYLEDCLGGMRRLLADESVNVVVTSPPYNIGVKYNHYEDKREKGDYQEWIEIVAQEIWRVLEPEGSFFFNVGHRPQEPWLAWDVANLVRRHFCLQNVIIWVKSIAIPKKDVGAYPNVVGDVAVGHYKPISSKRFLHDNYEYIFHFTKTGTVPLDRLAVGVPYQDKSNIGRWKAARQDLRCRGNTWFIPYQTIRDRASERPHPSTFPVQLPEMCIKLHGVDRTSMVMDPFMGIGSTALACYHLGVPCIGFEIDPTYIEQAKERLLSEVEITSNAQPHDLERADSDSAVNYTIESKELAVLVQPKLLEPRPNQSYETKPKLRRGT